MVKVKIIKDDDYETFKEYIGNIYEAFVDNGNFEKGYCVNLIDRIVFVKEELCEEIKEDYEYIALPNKKINCNKILLVEDGSIDIDNLEEENMCAGKILVYRQGAKKPEILSENINKYDVYEKEEQRLLEEFSRLVGDIDYRIFLFEKWIEEDNRLNKINKSF